MIVRSSYDIQFRGMTHRISVKNPVTNNLTVYLSPVILFMGMASQNVQVVSEFTSAALWVQAWSTGPGLSTPSKSRRSNARRVKRPVGFACPRYGRWSGAALRRGLRARPPPDPDRTDILN